MRTKGKMEIQRCRCNKLQVEAGLEKPCNSYLLLNPNSHTGRFYEEDAKHLQFCWNAFEPGGLVERMKIFITAIYISLDDSDVTKDAESLLAEVESL